MTHCQAAGWGLSIELTLATTNSGNVSLSIWVKQHEEVHNAEGSPLSFTNMCICLHLVRSSWHWNGVMVSIHKCLYCLCDVKWLLSKPPHSWMLELNNIRNLLTFWDKVNISQVWYNNILSGTIYNFDVGYKIAHFFFLWFLRPYWSSGECETLFNFVERYSMFWVDYWEVCLYIHFNHSCCSKVTGYWILAEMSISNFNSITLLTNLHFEDKEKKQSIPLFASSTFQSYKVYFLKMYTFYKFRYSGWNLVSFLIKTLNHKCSIWFCSHHQSLPQRATHKYPSTGNSRAEKQMFPQIFPLLSCESGASVYEVHSYGDQIDSGGLLCLS